jgi:hypothetical protein
VLSLAVMAALATLQTPPAHTGDCKWVHGLYVIANGSSVRRVWIIGSHRVVAHYDDENTDISRAIQRYESLHSDSEGLYGDFHICAVENNRPGHMQHVRIDGMRRLTYRGKAF